MSSDGLQPLKGKSGYGQFVRRRRSRWTTTYTSRALQDRQVDLTPVCAATLLHESVEYIGHCQPIADC